MEAHSHSEKKELRWTRDSPLTKQFVRLFYGIMNTFPEYLYQFYGDGSRVIHSEFGPNCPPLTKSADTKESIQELQTNFYKDVSVVVKTAIPQISVEEGVLLLVSGVFKKTSNATQKEEDHFFTEALMLAPQKNGYYVLTDTLHIMNGTNSGCGVPFGWTEDPPSNEQPYSFYPVIKTCLPKTSIARISKLDPNLITEKSDFEVGESIEKPQVITPTAVSKSPKLDIPASDSETDTEEGTKKGSKNNKGSSKPYPSRKLPPSHHKLTTGARINGPLGGGRVPGSTPLRVGVGVPPGQLLKSRPTASTSDARMMSVPPGQGVFIARLPFGIQPEEVVKAFSIFGPILNGADGIQVRDGRNGCYAFVTFESAASAQAAIQNGAIVQGKRVFVEQRNPPPDNTDPGYNPLPVGMHPTCVMPLRFPTAPNMVSCCPRRPN